jgi:hypothetical protein
MFSGMIRAESSCDMGGANKIELSINTNRYWAVGVAEYFRI